MKKKTKKVEKPLPLAKIAPLSLAESVEKVLIAGDLSPLTPAERVDYYKKVCMSLGLNPLTSPFMYILFREPGGGQPKLSLYATKSCAEQLRKIHGVSVIPPFRRTRHNDIITVEVDVRDKTGRTDTASGSVPTFKWKDSQRVELQGAELCNADMKAETKAKRRATLSISGLAFLDESELDTMTVVGGVTPDGRIYQYRDAPPAEPALLNENAPHGHAPGSPQALMAEAALKRSEEEDRKLAESQKGVPEAAKVAPLEPLPADAMQVVIDWHDKDNPVVTGDADAIEALKPLLHWGKDEFWHVKAVDAVKIGEACAAAKYRFSEILPERPSAAAPVAPKSAREGGGKPKATTAPVAETVSGMIQHFTEKMTKGDAKRPSAPFLSVLLKTETGDRWYSIFKRDLIDYVGKSKGKNGEFFVVDNGKFKNIVGIKRIGNTEFEDNLPVIQQKTREAGSLFT